MTDPAAPLALQLLPRCVATTGQAFCQPISKIDEHASHSTSARNVDTSGSPSTRERFNLFRSTRFSSDGTTLITHNEDQQLRTFILPPTLLDDDDEHTDENTNNPPNQVPDAPPSQSQPPSTPTKNLLTPYTTYTTSGSNIQAFALNPHFTLSDPNTTTVLCARAHAPLTLRNALTPSWATVHATYRFVSSTTEAHQSVRSLHFSRDGGHFVAGGDNVLAVWASARDGSDPISEVKLKGGRGTGGALVRCKGSVLALGIRSDDGLLAAGTSEREIALWEHEGRGVGVAGFELPRSFPGMGEVFDIAGTGVTSLKWSPCGRFLLAAERRSACVLVYDVRNTSSLVAVLRGREARTQQRLGIGVVPTVGVEGGNEVWAGGTDGCVKVWRDPGLREGEVRMPGGSFVAHGSTVADVAWHPGGAVLASCAGAYESGGEHWDEGEDGDGETREREGQSAPASPDCSLKVWTV